MVIVAYGYNVWDKAAGLGIIPPVKDSAVITRLKLKDEDRREPVLRSLGCHLVGHCLPKPNHSDPRNLAAGACKRFLHDPPKPKRGLIRGFRRFVAKWCKLNLSPLSTDTDLSVHTWLQGTGYSKERQDELLRIYEECHNILSSEHYKVKMFQKEETYTDFKYPRPINSRSDEFKTLVGPVFKAIESDLFKRPEFIKKIPIPERPQYIMDLLQREGSQYIATDYSSFESLFTCDLLHNCEMILYSHMVSGNPSLSWFMPILRQTITGVNRCGSKFLGVKVRASRMSGEMCTSLGNGFSNLMLMLYVCKLKGSLAAGVVEGDDGLFRIEGPLPSVQDFVDLGLEIKLETHKEVNKASFCGQVFDSEDLKIVTDPIEKVAAFGWTGVKYIKSNSKVLKALLRAKAFSTVYQYPGCPILSSMGKCYLRLTSGIDVRKFVDDPGWGSVYERDKLRSALVPIKDLDTSIPMQTRLLVLQKYGVSIRVQEKYEAYFDSLQEIEPIPNFFDNVPAPFANFWSTYVKVVDLSDNLLSLPPDFFPVKKIQMPISFPWKGGRSSQLPH